MFKLQLDLLVFPPNPVLEERLRAISGSYFSGNLKLSEVLDAAYSLTGKYSMQNDFLALSAGHVGMEDVWCIDQRGLLTLVLTKETYQQLGIVGEKLTKKSELHVVHIDLYDRNSSQFARAKESIRLWDERRRSQGIGPWQVRVQAPPSRLETKLHLENAQFSCTTFSDILVPALNTSAYGFGVVNTEHAKPDEAWRERMDELFEWVGMACIGADRLKANDRVNPFVAVYEAPAPSTVGSVTHFRWHGFLGPAIIRHMLETAIDSVRKEDEGSSFISITANTFDGTPVSYISPKAFAEGARNEMRLGRSNKSVRCWSLVVKLNKDKDKGSEWALASVESQV